MRVHGWMLVSSVPLTACGGGDDADDDGGGPSFTHPAGVKADSVNPGGGPFGISMVPGTIYYTRLYQQSLGRWTLGDGGVEAASVGNAPTDVDVAVQRLFVADQLDSRISVLGQNSGAASDPIPITGNPFRVRASSADGRVLVIDAATRTVQPTLPRRVRYSSSGARAYVTTESGWVYEIR